MPSASAPGSRLLVYEYLTAGGQLPDLDPATQADLRAQGRAMHDAMLDDLARIPGLVVDSWAGADDHARALAERARQGWTIWAVAPESDGTLERLARAVPPAAWFGCDPNTIALTASKRATVRHLAAHGIAVPGSAGAGVAAHAWVVKPDDGAGAADTRRHATRAAAEADLARRHGAATLEPWVEGDPLSLALACGHGRAELLAINRQHLKTGADGQLHFEGVSPAAIALDTPLGHALARLVPALADALPGLRGYVGVDLVVTPAGQPVVIEVNPRLTSAYVGLSARLGRNVAERLLALAA